MELQQTRELAEQIARRAGEAVMQHWLTPLEEITKANIHDIVTVGDKASEAVIVPALRELFPDHHIVSEEGGGTDLNSHAAEYYWFIDPIDGTTNFAHGIPHFAVSMAMTDRERNPLVSVVYNPVFNECFTAARGHGATLNGRRLQVTTIERLQQGVLGSGFSTHKEKALENLRYWQTFMMNVRDLRRFGSATLDICYVAAGRLDGFWEANINPWDVLPGALCVMEAGGQVSDYSGGMTRLVTGAEVVASNGRIHSAMLDILNDRTE